MRFHISYVKTSLTLNKLTFDVGFSNVCFAPKMCLCYSTIYNLLSNHLIWYLYVYWNVNLLLKHCLVEFVRESYRFDKHIICIVWVFFKKESRIAKKKRVVPKEGHDETHIVTSNEYFVFRCCETLLTQNLPPDLMLYIMLDVKYRIYFDLSKG